MSYFTDKELSCKCGCGMIVEKSLMEKLNKARELAGVSFVITSGARCKDHNRKVGGTPNSAHVRGMAADIAYTSSKVKFAILKGLFAAGFNRIGDNPKKSFIHCDIDATLPQDVFFDY